MSDEADFTVRLIDKVKGPAKTATKGVQALGDAAEHTGRQLSEADKKLGRFIDKTGKMREANGRFVAGQRSAGGMLGFSSGSWDVFKGNFLTGAANKLMQLGAAAVVAGAQTVTFAQNMGVAFTQLAKHGATPELLLEHASELAKRFGLDLQETTKQYSKFLALQFDPAAADRLVRLGADLRALGTDAEGVQGVFTALGQVKGKGRLQAEELLQMAERGVSTVLIQEEIGKLLGGKDTKAVQKLMQQGKVDAETGLAAIENAIKRKLGEANLGDAGAKFADTTIDGITGRFKAFAQDAGMKMLSKVAEPVTAALGQGLTKFIGFLESPQGQATMAGIADALGRAAEFAGDLANAFGGGFSDQWDKLSKGAAPFFEMLGGGDADQLLIIGKSLGELAALGVATAVAFGLVATGVGYLSAILWDVGMAALDGLVQTLGEAYGALISWWDTLSAIWNDGSKGFLEKAWELGANIMTGLYEGIQALMYLPFTAIANVGTKIADTLADVLGIHSPSRVTFDMGANLGKGLALGTESSERMVASAGSDMATASLDGAIWGPSSRSLPADSAVSGGGRGDIVVHLTTQVDGAGADANEIAELSAKASRRELEAFFRQLAYEV